MPLPIEINVTANAVVLPCRVVEAGHEWRLYSVHFRTDEGTQGTYIYARSHDHAIELVRELKQSACVIGELVGVYDPDDLT